MEQCPARPESLLAVPVRTPETAANQRAEVFRHEGDYHAFYRLLRAACTRLLLRLLAHWLMSNLLHLVLWPDGHSDLSDGMGWLLTAHVRPCQKYQRFSGDVGQGRCKALLNF